MITLKRAKEIKQLTDSIKIGRVKFNLINVLKLNYYIDVKINELNKIHIDSWATNDIEIIEVLILAKFSIYDIISLIKKLLHKKEV